MYIVYLSGHPVYTFIHDNKREQRQNRQVSVYYYNFTYPYIHYKYIPMSIETLKNIIVLYSFYTLSNI